MKINAGNLKKGDFILHEGEVWQVQKSEFYSPGKGSALMKTKIKNLISGKNIDFTFKSNEEIELIEVESIEMQYLYKDESSLYFMDERNFNQYAISLNVVGKIANFLKEGCKVFVYLYDERPLNIRPPMNVKLKVIETEEAVKGDTVTGAKKAAKVETGAIVMVPIFIRVNDVIIINPETGEYTGRA